MTTEKTDNELIAEFMGYKCDSENFAVLNVWRRSRWEACDFHKSWDWLMPVVEKIRDIKDERPEHMTQVATVASAVCTIRLWAIYKAVVEFIKWYNTQSK